MNLNDYIWWSSNIMVTNQIGTQILSLHHFWSAIDQMTVVMSTSASLTRLIDCFATQRHLQIQPAKDLSKFINSDWHSIELDGGYKVDLEWFRWLLRYVAIRLARAMIPHDSWHKTDQDGTGGAYTITAPCIQSKSQKGPCLQHD